MKVVLFCGGLGTRLREHSDTIPKPLVNIGYRPILWHLMRYYAHFGHTDFILCLGYRGDLIREYFLNYKETETNDFTLSGFEGASKKVELHTRDMQDWHITFVDTGLHSNIGQRLLRVKKHLAGEQVFLANYADGLSDLPLDKLIADFNATQGGGELRRRAQRAELPRRAGGRGWHGDAHGRHARAAAADQRRLLRLAPGDLRLHERRRGAGRAAVRTADRRAQARRPTAGTASGSAWTPSRTRSASTAWTRAASARG